MISVLDLFPYELASFRFLLFEHKSLVCYALKVCVSHFILKAVFYVLKVCAFFFVFKVSFISLWGQNKVKLK